MSAATESGRDRVIRRVMRSISRRVVNSGPLPVQGSDGSYPIVVALPEDTVADMEARRDRISRDANVVVAFPERMVLIAMRDAAREDPQEIPSTMTMAELVLFLQNAGQDVPAIRVASPDDLVPEDVVLEEMAYAF